MELRPFQNRIISETRVALREHSGVLIQSPTGSGKTVLTGFMLSSSARKKIRSWFVVHRRELINQSVRTFKEVGLPHTVISAGFPYDRRQLTCIASVGTLIRRVDRLESPKLIIWDEGHHCAAKSWATLHAKFPNAKHILLTATPERLDGEGLSRFASHMVKGPSVAWLIAQGYLADYDLYRPPGIDVTGVHTRMGDFVQAELSAIVDNNTVTGDAITHYLKHCHGKRAVVFAVSIKHSEHIVDRFKKAGIPAAHVDGKTPDVIRDATIRAFERGEIMILSNVALFSEGFDVPAIEAIIDLAPTMSLANTLQRWGRALRPAPGKDKAVILDHAGNSVRFGLPDDEREWSLAGNPRVKRREKSESPVRQCPMCYHIMPAMRRECTSCGYQFPVDSRTVDEIAGDLAAVDKEAARRLQRQQDKFEQFQAKDFDALVELGKRKRYRDPQAWAGYVIKGREAKKARAAR